MPNNWKKYKLGDLIDVKHGYAFKGEFFSDTPTKDILLSPGNFNIGGGFKADKFKYYKGVVPEDYVLSEGDLLITMTDLSPKGDTLGTTALIPKHDGINYLHNQRLGLVILQSEEISTNYLYWALRSNNYHNFIVSSATGSTVRHTSPSRIKDFEILLPPPPEQQAIAEILSALDDKIELNLQTNKTLEDMANALYKHWFVDFGPFKDGKFVESELGLIPDGWEVKDIYSICDVIYGFPFKSSLFNNKEIGTPLIRIRDIKLADPDNYTTETNERATIIKPGDVVAGMDALFTPYIWLGKNGYLNQRVVHFRPKNEISRYFIFQVVKPILQFHENTKVGTTVIHLGKSDIDRFRVIVPPKKLLEKYSSISDSLLERLILNAQEIATLKQTRDYLLPKLISGEIRVKEAHNKVKDLV